MLPSPTEINVTLYREVGHDLSHVVLTRSPFAAKDGYVAGEPPDGLTTNEDEPVEAEIRVVVRDKGGFVGDGHVAAITTSGPDGTWMATGLSPERRYDIIGRRDGFDDVIVANVKPIPINRIYSIGSITYDQATGTFSGELTIVGGFLPYSLGEMVTPPPDGTEVVLDGRTVVITGATTPGTEVPLVVFVVSSSNGASQAIQIGQGGLVPPTNLKLEHKILFKPTRLVSEMIRAEDD